MEYRTIRLYNI